MERQANYTMVGLLSLVLIAGLLAFSLWLARITFNQEYVEYDVVFMGPVSGLSQGGEVQFNGIKVGEVTHLDLDKLDPRKVIARIRITASVPVRSNSFGTLEPMGITGVNFVQISSGTVDLPLLKSVTPPDLIPVIKTQNSTITDLVQGGGTVLTRTIETLDRVNAALSEQNVKQFSQTLAHINSVTSELDRRKVIIADADRAILALAKTAEDVSALSQASQSLVSEDGRNTLTRLSAAADELKAAAQDARGTLAKFDQPSADLTNTVLPQLSSTITTLQSSAMSLDRLVIEIERNPQSLLSKAPAKEHEVSK
jgi:phospholipid/cholesterol/gamma-HCH transport system substrate-binding protein